MSSTFVTVLALLLGAGCAPSGHSSSGQATEPGSSTMSLSTHGRPGERNGQASGEWLAQGPIYETHPYYYDGTFKAITNQIPSLAELGIKTLYLMPVFEQKQGDPPYILIYVIRDYQKTDPAYGTPEDLKELVATAHSHGMRVLFDLVTTATPPGGVIWSNGWTLSIALAKLEKLFPDLERATVDGEIFVYRRNAAKPDSFDVFGRLVGDTVILHCYPSYRWGPAVDRSRPEVVQYFSQVAARYVTEYDIDGWRVDAPANNWNPAIIPGDHSSRELVRSVQAAIVAAKPGAVLYGEAPMLIPSVDADPALDEFMDASYSYLFLGNLGSGSLKTSEQLVAFLNGEKIWFQRARSRFTETHDTARTSRWAPHMAKPLLVLVSTIPGMPMIQAGQEIGAANEWFHQLYTEPPAPVIADPRVDWAHGDREMREFFRKVFSLRERHEALRAGSIADVWKSGDNTFAYVRKTSGDTVIVVINFNGQPASSLLSLSSVPLGAGTTLKDELSGQRFVVSDPGRFAVSVPAYGARILVPFPRVLTEGNGAPVEPRR